MDASAFSTCCLSIYIVAVYFRKYAFLLIRSGYTIDNRWLLAHTQMSTMWKLEEATVHWSHATQEICQTGTME